MSLADRLDALRQRRRQQMYELKPEVAQSVQMLLRGLETPLAFAEQDRAAGLAARRMDLQDRSQGFQEERSRAADAARAQMAQAAAEKAQRELSEKQAKDLAKAEAIRAGEAPPAEPAELTGEDAREFAEAAGVGEFMSERMGKTFDAKGREGFQESMTDFMVDPEIAGMFPQQAEQPPEVDVVGAATAKILETFPGLDPVRARTIAQLEVESRRAETSKQQREQAEAESQATLRQAGAMEKAAKARKTAAELDAFLEAQGISKKQRQAYTEFQSTLEGNFEADSDFAKRARGIFKGETDIDIMDRLIFAAQVETEKIRESGKKADPQLVIASLMGASSKFLDQAKKDRTVKRKAKAYKFMFPLGVNERKIMVSATNLVPKANRLLAWINSDKVSDKDFNKMAELWRRGEALIPFIDTDEEKHQMFTELVSQFNQTLKLRSGAQVTDGEAVRIFKELAHGGLSRKVARARLTALQETEMIASLPMFVRIYNSSVLRGGMPEHLYWRDVRSYGIAGLDKMVRRRIEASKSSSGQGFEDVPGKLVD